MIYTNKEIKIKINKIGLKSNPQFKCTNPMARRNKHQQRMIEVQCFTTNQKKTVNSFDICSGKNPFYINATPDHVVFEKINKIGLKSNPQFKCTNPMVRRTKHGDRIIEVQCLTTNEKKVVQSGNICSGQNPFNKIQNRIELNIVHPMAVKMVQKLGFKVEPNYKLGKQSIIDLRLSHTKLDFTIGTELKQSEKFHDYSKDQKQRYTSKSKLKQHNMMYIFFADPVGAHKKHGFISFKELSHSLKQILKAA